MSQATSNDQSDSAPVKTMHRIPAASCGKVIMKVCEGDSFAFTASGTWIDWFIRTDAHGYDSRIPALFNLWPDVPFSPLMALCGRITSTNGQRTETFVIGRGCEWRAPFDGKLCVFANDITLCNWFRDNNSGELDLQVTRIDHACPRRADADGDAVGLHRLWRRFLKMMHKTEGTLAIAALVVLTMAVLGLLPQGQDIIAAVTEDADPRTMIWMTLALLFLSLQAWFWPRRIVEANYGSQRKDWQLFKPLLVWGPRLLGLLPYLVVIWLVFLNPPEASDAANGWWRALITAGLALTFMVFVIFRQSIVRRRQSAAWKTFLKFVGLLWPVFAVLASFGLFLAILISPAYVGQNLGPAAIVIFAVAGFIPLIALAAQAGAIYHVPAAFLIFLWVVICSPFNDDQHTIGRRVFTGKAPILAEDTRPLLKDKLEQWAGQVATRTDANGVRYKPMIIVASEGGASRAGYWTAVVLNDLQQKTNGAFSNQVFAISSISGGSVGAVGWVKSLHFTATTPPQTTAGRRHLLRTFAAGDQLSPAMASSLFPSITQRFLPFAALPDGGEGLERGFERSWSRACEGLTGCDLKDDLHRPFLDLWPAPKAQGIAAWYPMVFVGGAIEESGRRIITAPAKFTDGKDSAIDAEDYFEQTRKNISQSTAITNGARFPWISPPGLVHKRGGNYHIVDGGYFDATGLETARELAEWVSHQEIGEKVEIRPIIVVVNYEDSPREERMPSRPVANDLLGPLIGLYSSRDGHQAHMLRAIKPDAEPGTGIGFTVCGVKLRGDAKHDLPLDWVLSSKMRNYADRQPGKGRTGDEIQGIIRVMAGVTKAPVPPAEPDPVLASCRFAVQEKPKESPVVPAPFLIVLPILTDASSAVAADTAAQSSPRRTGARRRGG